MNKYANYINEAQDLHLKALFESNYRQEQHHVNTLEQLLGGQVPAYPGQQPGWSAPPTEPSRFPPIRQGGVSDADMCNDLLTAENQLAESYSAAISGVVTPQIRQAFNQFLNDAQQHSAGLSDYLSRHGLYQR